MRALFNAASLMSRRLLTADGQVSPAFRSVSYGARRCGEPQFAEEEKYFRHKNVMKDGPNNLEKNVLQIPALAGRLIRLLIR